MKKGRPIATIAIVLSIIALTADILTLIMIDTDKFMHKVEIIINFIAGERSAKVVANLPFVQQYSDIWPVYLVFFTFLTTITFFEFREQIIPDAVTIPGIILGICLAAGFQHISILSSISGAAIGFFFLWGVAYLNSKFTGSPGLGGGLIKMQGMIGAFLGLQNGITALGLAFLFGIFYSLIVALIKKRTVKQTIELGPFLAVSSLIVTFFPIGSYFIRW